MSEVIERSPDLVVELHDSQTSGHGIVWRLDESRKCRLTVDVVMRNDDDIQRLTLRCICGWQVIWNDTEGKNSQHDGAIAVGMIAGHLSSEPVVARKAFIAVLKDAPSGAVH